VIFSVRSRFAWLSFDWAQRPLNLIVLTYIFAPFFSGQLAPDPVTGQAAWGLAIGLSGVLVAILSPYFGSLADIVGPKKPWIAVFGSLLVLGSGCLWFADPGAPGAMYLAMVLVVLAVVGSELAIVLHNSTMPLIAPLGRMGALSGTAWAVGAAGGLAALIGALMFVIVSDQTGKTILGLAPPFGLTAVAQDAARLAGPTGLRSSRCRCSWRCPTIGVPTFGWDRRRAARFGRLARLSRKCGCGAIWLYFCWPISPIPMPRLSCRVSAESTRRECSAGGHFPWWSSRSS
jgi:MFS family permease